jgi:pyruvate dehydrogenase E1 component beta subunit
VTAVTYIPYQGNTMCFEIIQEHVGKLRTMTGGDAALPITLILEESGQRPGYAGQHADYEIDSYYMHIPGVKTVVPSTPSDAKGLLVSAIQDPDPVVYINPAGLRTLEEEVADEQFAVPIGQAAVRATGGDITIVGHGPSMPEVLKATARLQKDGVGVEAIDLRSLKPMDVETLVRSVQKTRRLLTVDQTYYTLCPGAEVVASVAAEVSPARFKRVAFPDAAPPAAPEMFLWMRPNDEHVYQAARKLLG